MVKIVRKTSKGVYFTPKGLTSAREELQSLKGEKRREIAERIQRAREYGDLAENSEYDAAMEEQTFVEGRIAELESQLKDAKVIAEAPNNDFVVIGSTVLIEMDGEEDEFTIVGRVEADPSKKRISNESPLGSSLMGAKKVEVLEFTTPIVR